MTTKDDLIKQFKKDYPILKSGNDNDFIELNEAEREVEYSRWADNELERVASEANQAKAENDKLAAKQSAQAKLAALGLTEEEVASILG